MIFKHIFLAQCRYIKIVQTITMIFRPSELCTYLGHPFHWLRLGQALTSTAESFPRLPGRLTQLLRKLLTLLTKLRLTDFLYCLKCEKGTYIYLRMKNDIPQKLKALRNACSWFELRVIKLVKTVFT